MSTELKNMIDKAVSILGIKRVIYSLQSGKELFNIKSSDSDKEVLDYLNDLLIKERDQKLSSILGERKIYKFSEFIKNKKRDQSVSFFYLT